jgi:hypothetical protein
MIVPSRRFETMASLLESTTAASSRGAENSSGKPENSADPSKLISPHHDSVVQPPSGLAIP